MSISPLVFPSLPPNPIDRPHKKAFVSTSRHWHEADNDMKSLPLLLRTPHLHFRDSYLLIKGERRVKKKKTGQKSPWIKIFIFSLFLSLFLACAFQLFLKYLAMSISKWAELADEHNFPLDWAPYCCGARSRFLRSLSFPVSLAQLLLSASAKLHTTALVAGSNRGPGEREREMEGKKGGLARERKREVAC